MPFREKPWLWGEDWRLGVVPHSYDAIVGQPHLVQETQWLPIPWSNGYSSDPWLVKHLGNNLVFFEHYDKTLGRGIIACGDLISDGGVFSLNNVRSVLEEPYHLSHPCVFSDQGHWYLLPEAADTGGVVLYEAVDFPNRWRKLKTIIPQVPGLDPTFFTADNRFWISCSFGENTHNSDLYLFHAQDLLGPWIPHSGNPVKSDLFGARPAGPVFSTGGQVFRLGQDSRFTYGQGVVIHEIESLSMHEFQEKVIGSVTPPVKSPFNHGLHSLCVGDDFCLIDAKRFTGLKRVLGPAMTWVRQIKNKRMVAS